MTTWRVERTGWRDDKLSERHGHWGFNCPAVDLDFVMMEYNHGKPAALVEYKHKLARHPDLNHATYRALNDLANGYMGGPLPCFVAIYDPDNWSFRVIPINQKAEYHYSHCVGKTLTEQEFVLSLHMMRKAVLTTADREAIAMLNSVRDSDEEDILHDE